MKIWFRVHGYEFCSWTVVWQNLLKAFTALGHDVCGVDNPEKPEEYVELWWGDPQYWVWSNYKVKARVAMALSENRSLLASGKNQAIRNLQEAELLICPSEFSTTAFQELPLDMPIRVAIFGVDPTEFPYHGRDWSKTIRYLHAGVTQYRKGSWLVPEAFIQAFRPGDEVSLTISTFKVSPMYLELQAEYGNHPLIKFSSEIVESAVELYNTHHIYVSPHLSEGFGMMPLEAMATGMPCLLSRCSSPREYFDKEYGWWIEMSEMYGPVEACLPHTPGFWRVPDIDSLVDDYIESFSHRKECQAKGIKASQFVESNMTWRHTAQQIVKIIKEELSEDFSDSDSI